MTTSVTCVQIANAQNTVLTTNLQSLNQSLLFPKCFHIYVCKVCVHVNQRACNLFLSSLLANDSVQYTNFTVVRE